MRVCALACVPVRPPPVGYVIRDGREEGSSLWSLFFWLRRSFDIREGDIVVQSEEDLSNLQASVSVWPFRSTNFV